MIRRLGNWAYPGKQAGAVAVLPELVPDPEHPFCDLKPGPTELLLGGEAFALGR